MISNESQDLVDLLRHDGRRFDASRTADTLFDPLIKMIGDARFVLIGEASHGTHEFYDIRAELTKRLIREKGFNAVVAEADWPDAYRVNRYVRGFNDDQNEFEALDGFKRFPQWMWRNTVVVDFVRWLRQFNGGLRPGARPQCGFYGMDLYSLYASIESVLKFLANVDPEAAKRARYRYSCFEDFGEDAQAYGYAAAFDLDRSCEQQAIAQLVDLRRRAVDYARRDGRMAEDEYFNAEQNARIILNAEEYYRHMFADRVSTWNLRDRHMVETLDSLVRYLDQHEGRGRTKVAVWAHNSHLGDARATEMGEAGEVNVGQLCRERWGGEVINIGFSTYTGTVTAADNWDEEAQLKRVRPGLPGSYEAIFHDVGFDFVLPLRELSGDISVELRRRPRLQRAIGVIYRPQTERLSHYFNARLAAQFDAMIHIDQTRALEPLERTPAWTPQREFETYPSGV
jgi:erythromycin esterase-like protein